MKEHEYQNAIREVAFYFLAAPTIILLGMALVGTILDSFLKTNNMFAQLFVYIGGIPGVGAYYYKRWKEFSKSQMNIPSKEELNKTLEKLNNTLERIEKKFDQ